MSTSSGYTPFCLLGYSRVPPNSPKRLRKPLIVWNAALFDRLPAEILQRIAEHVIRPSDCILDGRSTCKDVVRRLLKQCCFSAAFASATLKAFSRIKVLQIPASDLTGMAQRSRDGPLLLHDQRTRVILYKGGRFHNVYHHRELAFSPKFLRHLKLDIATYYEGLDSWVNNIVFTELFGVLPRVHIIFPGLRTIQVHLKLGKTDCDDMFASKSKHNVSHAFKQAFARDHSRFFRLIVLLNRLQKYVRRVKIIVETIVVDVSGDWGQVMERLRASCLFCNMEWQYITPFFFLTWLELGAARTRRLKGRSCEFEMADEVVDEDGSNVLAEYMVKRFGIEYGV